MRVTNKRQYFIDAMLELIGIKSGLGIFEDKMVSILEEDFTALEESSYWWKGDRLEIVSMRAEEYESYFIVIMNKIGAIPDRKSPSELVFKFCKQHGEYFKFDKKDLILFVKEVSKLDMAIGLNDQELLEEYKSLTGIDKLIRECRRRDILDWNIPDSRDWDGIISLNELFNEEEIPISTTSDHYFDQRFINYLYVQEKDLKNIHWRQFEYLTAEFFKRKGFHIKITPARKDGGKDIIASKDSGILGPDLIIIECKRHSYDNPVDIQTVKAFWTTVNDEGATKGLIATTSHLTRDAKDYCNVRKYRLSFAESENVKRWLKFLVEHS